MGGFIFLLGVSAISNRNDQNPWRALALVSVMGIDLAVFVLLGFWAGKWLDRQLQTEPIFLIVGIILGMIVGVGIIIRLIKPFLED